MTGPLRVWAARSEPPLDPSGEEGRRLAREELARPEYHQPRSVVEQVLSWLHVQRRRMDPDAKVNLDPETMQAVANILLVLLVVGLVALVVLIVLRVRLDPRRRSRGGTVLDGEELLPPDQYLDRARAALAAGDWDAAVVEAFRAITSRSAERTLLDDAPSLTAHEVGNTLSGAFPDHAARLGHAADLFDLVRYGFGRATEGDARGVLELEATLARTRPRHEDAAPPAGPLVAPGAPVPDAGTETDA